MYQDQETAAVGKMELREVSGSGQYIDYVNRTHPLRRVVTRFSLRVRRKFYRMFLAYMEPTPGASILDVGVTPDQTVEDSNYLEKWYAHPEQITATSVEDASVLEASFPGLRFVRTNGTTLPFAQNEFDVAFSTAVLEHVGDRDHQREFLYELLRVSKKFFVTTPNRGFPLELHTFLPIIHWFPRSTHQWLLRHLGQSRWATTENLNLLSRKELRSLFPRDVEVTIAAVKIWHCRTNLVAYGSCSDWPT